MKRHIALDAGGTSVRAALITDRAEVLARAHGGRANPVSSGRNVAFDALVDVVTQTVAESNSAPADIDSITICSAGGTAFGGREWLEKNFHDRGITSEVHLRSDLLAAFCSGAVEPQGYGLVAGTGAAAVRVAGGEIVAVADGMGWLLGDGGSGFQIGQSVARAVVAELDQRGPATALTPALLEHVGLVPDPRRGPEGRVHTLVALGDLLFAWAPIELASLAPIVFQCSKDAVAQRIIAAAQAELAHSLGAVLDPATPGPVVLAGSVLTQQPGMAGALEPPVRRAEIPVDLRTVGDGLTGASVVALRAAGIRVDQALHDRVSAGLARRHR